MFPFPTQVAVISSLLQLHMGYRYSLLKHTLYLLYNTSQHVTHLVLYSEYLDFLIFTKHMEISQDSTVFLWY